MSKLNLHLATCKLEIRKRDDGQNVIRGLAIPYNQDSHPIWGEFIERFAPGSVRNMRDDSEVFAYVEHDSRQVLGRRSNKTLELIDTPDGVYAETCLNNTTYAQDLAENIRTGVVKGMSFGFYCYDDTWDNRAKLPIRTVKDCEIREVTYTHNPAYPDTTASLRSGYMTREEMKKLMDEYRTSKSEEEFKAEYQSEWPLQQPTIVDLMRIRGV